MVLFYGAVVLLLISSVMHKSYGIKGYFNNIQIASGSSVVFPNFPENSPKQEIPLELLLRMNQVTDTGEFIENFVYPDLDNTTLSKILSGTSHSGVERKGGSVRFKTAVCKPEPTTISLKPEEDFTTYYHPPCIRIERCGGCCNHRLVTCVPTESEIVSVLVMVLEYKGGSRMVHTGEKSIPVEKHTNCSCGCIIKPENCTRSQVYKKDKCICECANTDAEKKCNADIRNKIWDRKRCLCLCKEEQECSTGYYFDFVSCRCEILEGRRRPLQRPWIP